MRKSLPPYFKTIGIIVNCIGLALMIGIIVLKETTTLLDGLPKDLMKQIITDGIFCVFILGLLFIILSRDKEEDEMMRDIKIRAMAASLPFAAAMVIVSILEKFLWYKDPEPPMLHSTQLVLFQLFMYWINLRNIKARLKKEADEEQA